jgi:hypothetical protein
MSWDRTVDPVPGPDMRFGCAAWLQMMRQWITHTRGGAPDARIASHGGQEPLDGRFLAREVLAQC